MSDGKENETVRAARNFRRKPRAGALDAAIGARLRARRIELGLSLSDVARLLRMSYQQIDLYECGRTRISAARLVDAARALGLGDLNWLFDLGLASKDIDSRAGYLSLEALELGRILDGMESPGERRHLMTIARALQRVRPRG